MQAAVCVPSPKAECVPAFARESKRGAFVREVEKCAKSGLEQRCNSNFLAIVAGTILSEKPNFTGRFFEWRRPFDVSTRYSEVPLIGHLSASKPRSAGLSGVLKPQSKVHLERHFRSHR